MQAGINIEEVRKYNASLKEYKDKSARLLAEIEVGQKELARQCAELTNELGVQVTPENISTILAERIEKINSTMQMGNDILQRIKAEEEMAAIPQTVTQATEQAQPVQSAQPAQQVVPPVPGVGVPQPPSTPDIFGGVGQIPGIPTMDGGVLPGTLPNIMN